MTIIARILSLLVFIFSVPAFGTQWIESDVCIYGGTSGGVAAVVQAARMGKTVVLIEPSRHLGGLTSGGLGATDIGNKGAIGGISREFYIRVARHYADDSAWRRETRTEYLEKRGTYQNRDRDPIAEKTGVRGMWTFEPSVAGKIMDEMVKRAHVRVFRQERLDLNAGVKKDRTRITSIKMESGKRFRAKMFIDAMYEGDLMAKAGVSYHVGREPNWTYGETLNGVQTKRATQNQFLKKVDPYVIPDDPSSGLLPGVHGGSPEEEGSGDSRVQAYNFRLCLTDAPDNRMPIPKPRNYDPLRYELLRRYIQAGVFSVMDSNTPMPNRKTDINNDGSFASDYIGMNYDYPDGSYAMREKIFRDHVDYQMGLWWFLGNDPHMPETVRKEVARWGLCKDEFTGTGGWPHQLYIREARRMISDLVMTEHHCRWTETVQDSVGMGAYNMDSHNVQRYVHDGGARNEGDVQVAVKGPYPIAYRSLIPKAGECGNLLVPVCLSASHIAYGSIRMEPVFMVLGQSAATAACLAIDDGVLVQKVSYPKLRERLLADRQVLEWEGNSPKKE